MKKKVVTAMATLALGAALAGAGTFAYFNDVDKINNSFATGTLNLDINKVDGQPISFELANLKPGDSIEREFHLYNDGSLAAEKILMTMTASDFADGRNPGDSNLSQFLNQFEVTLIKVDNASNVETDITESSNKPTLYDLLTNNLTGKITDYGLDDATGLINLAPTGFYSTDEDKVFMKITFKETGTNQNKFQGDSANFAFVLDAKQMGATEVKADAINGYLNMNKAKTLDTPITSENDDTQLADWPNDGTLNIDGSGVLSDETVVTDGDENPIESQSGYDILTDR